MKDRRVLCNLFWLMYVVSCNNVPPFTSEIEEEFVTTPVGTKHALVKVPQGVFTMGAEGERSDESPQHQVHLDGFYIDKFEVTNEKYLAFAKATGADQPVFIVSDLFNQSSQPVVGVVWEEANNYCAWAGLRLPSEAEWEKAARGNNGQIFPWGDNPPSQSLARYRSDDGPIQVGSFPNGASPYGALDMTGNVWEYVRDHYVEGFYHSGPVRNPVAIVSNGEPDHTIRGGGWGSSPEELRASRRGRVFLIDADLPDAQVGFRCAR